MAATPPRDGSNVQDHPSSKQLQTRVSVGVYEAFRRIADREHRSASRELQRLVEQRVADDPIEGEGDDAE